MTKSRAADGTRLYHCPVEATMDKIGGKYKAIVLYHLKEDGVLRFSELQRHIPQATPKMLTQQLRELEADGLVHREVYPRGAAQDRVLAHGVRRHPGPHHPGDMRLGRRAPVRAHRTVAGGH